MITSITIFMCLLIGVCIGCIIVLGTEIQELKGKIKQLENNKDDKNEQRN